jgi:oligoribonuclease
MIDKNEVPTKLLWVDLEMTGLDPEKDVILEVAAEITDFDFKNLSAKWPVESLANRLKRS